MINLDFNKKHNSCIYSYLKIQVWVETVKQQHTATTVRLNIVIFQFVSVCFLTDKQDAMSKFDSACGVLTLVPSSAPKSSNRRNVLLIIQSRCKLVNVANCRHFKTKIAPAAGTGGLWSVADVSGPCCSAASFPSESTLSTESPNRKQL